MHRKYEFTGETMEHEGYTLKRIRHLEGGYLGGWIEHEHNLSHEGQCWVYDEAKAYGGAAVVVDAQLHDDTCVYEMSLISGSSCLYGTTRVYGQSCVRGMAEIIHSNVYACAQVGGYANVRGDVNGDELIVATGVLPWVITATRSWATIGCQYMTAKEWLECDISAMLEEHITYGPELDTSVAEALLRAHFDV